VKALAAQPDRRGGDQKSFKMQTLLILSEAEAAAVEALGIDLDPHFDLPEITPAVLAAWFDVSKTAIKHSVSISRRLGPVQSGPTSNRN
jgi:hypothetical protein